MSSGPRRNSLSGPAPSGHATVMRVTRACGAQEQPGLARYGAVFSSMSRSMFIAAWLA